MMGSRKPPASDAGADGPPLESRDAAPGLNEPNALLAAIGDAMEVLVSGVDPHRACHSMVDILVRATGSEHGFLDEVLLGADGRPHRRRLAPAGVCPDTPSRGLDEGLEARAFEPLDPDDPAGAPVREGRVVIANEVASDLRPGGVLEGRRTVDRSMGIPLCFGGEPIGVVVVANRRTPYTEELAASVEPLARACAAIIHAGRVDERNREIHAALAASEEKYRGIVENLSDVVWIADLDFNATYVSPSVERLVGDTPDEHRQRRLEEKFPPSALATLRAGFAEEMEREQDPSSDRGRTREVEVQHYHSDGSLVWVAMHLSFVRDERGRAIGIQGSTRDISERKQLEDEQLRLQERLSQAVEIARLGYWEYDVATDTFSFDDSFYRIFRTTARDVGGYSMSSREYAERFVHPDDRQVVADEIRLAIEAAQPTSGRRLEHRIVYADGSVGHISVLHFVSKDDEGRTVRTFGVNQDITERRLAEQALEESERKWRTVLAETPQIGISLDPQARIVFANSHFLQLTGWTEPEVLGRDWYELFIPEEIRPEVRRVFDAVVGNGDTVGFSSYENEILTRTGDRRTIAWSNVLTKDVGGGVVDVTCLGIDLTERKRAEDELRTREAKYRLLVENQTDLVVKVDPEGRFLFVSPSYCRTFGASESELLGQEFLPLVHDEDRASTELAMAALFRPPHTAYVEQRALTKDGWRWLAWADTAVLDDHGDVAEIIGVGRDITDQKQAEAERRQLSDIVDSSLSEIFVFDAESLGFRYANRGALRNLQYTLEEIRRMTPVAVAPEFTEETLRAAVGPLLCGDQESLTFETVHRRADGSEYPVEVHLQLMESAGERVFLAVIFDISARKTAEREIRESEERYRLLVENANELVLMAQDGLFVFVNRRAIAFFGYTPEELVGKPFADFIHPEDRTAVVQNHLKRLAGEELPEVYPFRILHRSGETRWVEIGAVRVEWQGRPATLNFMLDVTERRRAEEARETLQSQLLQAQKMESIGRLAGGVAHDFNNMLGVILARTEMMLADMPDADPRSEDLEEIRKAAVRSADLTRQLLAFARRQTIAPKVLDLNDTVEGMLKMLRRLIGEDIDLVWRPDADLWPVKMDPTQVDQILANLCVNARDAITEGGHVTIETSNVEVDETGAAWPAEAAPGRYVTLTVSDDGCGMDEKVRDHLFEPFFTTKETGRGTGLGLATVYGITRQNDGFVKVHSEVGKGTTFTVHLPAHRGDGAAATDSPPVVMPRARGETVLLVEDDPAILKVAVRMLARLGYTVVSASDPDEAMSLVREHSGPLDLLITDVVMPRRSGKILAEEVVALRPATRVLFMSGYTADIIAHRGVLDEGVRFIQKPFSMEELAVKVRRVMDGTT